MTKRRRNALQIVSLLLLLAALLQGNSPTSYAQSSNERTKKAYFIMGAVKTPGVYEIEGRPSVLKLIALAGWLTENHGAVAYIMRQQKYNPTTSSKDHRGAEYQVIQIYINAMLKLPGDFLDLEPDDIVNVPQAEVFLVAGEVNAPGSFPFKEGMTLLQALSVARGITVSAKPDKVIIFRHDPTTGKRLDFSVDLDALKSGKRKDVPILPYDVILVPNARTRTTPWPRLLEAPPIRGFLPCPGSHPCMAQLDLNLLQHATERD